MSLGFSDADSVPCAQQLDLTPKELAGEPIALKLTKVTHPHAAIFCVAGAPLLQLIPRRAQAVKNLSMSSSSNAQHALIHAIALQVQGQLLPYYGVRSPVSVSFRLFIVLSMSPQRMR
jgi:hypothetical protein